jgi:hypothetical protein
MKRILTMLAMAVSIYIVYIPTGCAPVSGTVTGTFGAKIGAMAPDIYFTSADGLRSSLDWARYPIALVAFTAPQSPGAPGVDPAMADLCDELSSLPVTVAQIALPQDGRTLSTHPRKSGMIFLYDAQRLAWDAYGRPAEGELMLIGAEGQILKTGSLKDPAPLLLEARRLGEIEKHYRDLYYVGEGAAY